MSYDARRRRSVASNHHRAHSQRVQFGNQRGGIRPGRIAESNDAGEFHSRGRADSNGQHAEALRLQLIRGCRCIGRGLREARNYGEGSLHGAHRAAARIGGSRFGHLRSRIERNELDQFRQIGGRFCFSGCADSGIHWILPGIRARERGQSKHVRLVEARHGVYGGYFQFVLSQRPGLVRA